MHVPVARDPRETQLPEQFAGSHDPRGTQVGQSVRRRLGRHEVLVGRVETQNLRGILHGEGDGISGVVQDAIEPGDQQAGPPGGVVDHRRLDDREAGGPGAPDEVRLVHDDVGLLGRVDLENEPSTALRHRDRQHPSRRLVLHASQGVRVDDSGLLQDVGERDLRE